MSTRTIKKAHIIFAHPNRASFNGRMCDKAIDTLKKVGVDVTISDLFQMKFKASADAEDFTRIHKPEFFDLQHEQSMALQNGTFADDIKREHSLLENAELVIFQFPVWWDSVPSLLKGYFDRIFSVGWAYGGGTTLMGKKALLSTTTGAPEPFWNEDQKGDFHVVIKPITRGTLGLCGMTVLDPFVVFGAKRISEEEKLQKLTNYAEYLKTII